MRRVPDNVFDCHPYPGPRYRNSGHRRLGRCLTNVYCAYRRPRHHQLETKWPPTWGDLWQLRCARGGCECLIGVRVQKWQRKPLFQLSRLSTNARITRRYRNRQRYWLSAR
jgi:hypothetical protein